MNRGFIVGIFVGIALAISVDRQAIASTQNGKVEGLSFDSHVEWRGIRFAASTEGNNRWRSPQPFDSWKGVKDAKDFGAGCPQGCKPGGALCANRTSEDCLFLNVFSPKKNEGKLYPVMFWIFGGTFELGEGASAIYVGGARTMASTKDVVVVTFNYRVGPLGFLVTGEEITGNYGIQDQFAALQWVQNNIKSFGGDPSRVTLAGQSAGAMSVSLLLAQPKAKGLYHQAILMSNPMTVSYKRIDRAKNWGAVFSSSLGCMIGDEVCLRSKSVQEIVRATSKVPPFFSSMSTNGSSLALAWQPVIDGVWVMNQTISSALNGEINPVPMIVGDLKEEARLFIYLFANTSIKNYVYSAVIGAFFGRTALKVLGMYPPPMSTSTDSRDQLSSFGSDYFFTCSNRFFASTLAKSNPVYLYQFTHKTQNNGPIWGKNKNCVGHVCHGYELPYLFSNVPTFSPEEILLSQMMVSYWTNFIHSGNPNSPSPLPPKYSLEWPKFDGVSRKSMTLETPPAVTTDLLGPNCDFLDQVGYNH